MTTNAPSPDPYRLDILRANARSAQADLENAQDSRIDYQGQLRLARWNLAASIFAPFALLALSLVALSFTGQNSGIWAVVVVSAIAAAFATVLPLGGTLQAKIRSTRRQIRTTTHEIDRCNEEYMRATTAYLTHELENR